MAGKPQVTLTLAGDESKLTSAFDRVGDAAQSMGAKVGSASEDFTKAGRTADDFAEKTDTAETRATGFADTLDGVKAAFETLSDPSASLGDKLINLGRAGADLAGGFTQFVIPAVSGLWQRLMATTVATTAVSAAQTAWAAVTKGVTVATAALNAVLRANPIMTVITIIGLLVGAFILLWTKSEGFRNFFIGMWNGIKSVVGGVVDWIKGAWNGVISFFGSIPGRIGTALGALGSIAKNIFKGAVNGVVDGLNWFLDHSINWLIDRVNDISGLIGIPAIPRIPHIPRMHTGGVVSGMPGTEQLRILQAGERVSTSSQGGGGGTVTFAGDLDSGLAKLIMRLIRTGEIRIEGA